MRLPDLKVYYRIISLSLPQTRVNSFYSETEDSLHVYNFMIRNTENLPFHSTVTTKMYHFRFTSLYISWYPSYSTDPW